MTLLDSLILEGLAEDAVKDLYGEKWIAPWLQSYSDKELLALWGHHFYHSYNFKESNSIIHFYMGTFRNG